MTEKAIENKLKKAIKLISKFALCFKFKVPGYSGVPDRLILLPGRRIYFVECKRPEGGILAPLQKKMHQILSALGFPVFVVSNDTELQQFIDYINL